MYRIAWIGVPLIALAAVACSQEPDGTAESMRFERLDARATGITFSNQLIESEERNVLSYEYFYNGGGVAVGDVNNDGLPDLFFTGNMRPNALYLNRGDLRFEEVTQAAGLAGRAGDWSTGASMVDINADGRLDIYVCYSGEFVPERRRNELYVNQGDGTFSEKASDYGLDITAFSTHGLFFDYDRDGDLDLYLLNHNIEEFQNFDASFVKKQTDPDAGDMLLRNDEGRFVNVTQTAGIINNPLGFGLGVAAGDLDGDGWLDLYISNDYIEEDYLYINQGDGTFREALREKLGHIPHFSMGSDISDINNDGLPDILALDMLPEDNRRQKLLFGPDSYEKYQSQLRNGFYHQQMRNMLQLNNGDGTFSEIGQLAGISNTDWSWAALFADLDNDGWKDLFVSNGYLRDYTNRDFMAYYANQRIREIRGEPSAALMEIIGNMESTRTHNYIFRGSNGWQFENKVEAWGFEDLLLTNGAAYADLDRDGDLDLVLNNINEPAAIYENRLSGGDYLQVLLQQDGQNPHAIGAVVEILGEGVRLHQLFMPVRGFQSAMHTPLHFGLPPDLAEARIRVSWPDGFRESWTLDERNTSLSLRRGTGEAVQETPDGSAWFSPIPTPVDYRHEENATIDFKRQALLPWMLSAEGPAVARGDVNGDGREDLFLGGAKLKEGQLFVQDRRGNFRRNPQDALRRDIIHEDVDAAFFDADSDGDLDLYVVSGGYDFLPEDLALQDRLYLNDGAGQFSRAADALPRMLVSGGTVAPADWDGDGDTDLFVGGRLVPGGYPLSPGSFLLENDGRGQFSDVTSERAPGLNGVGMVSGAAWIQAAGDDLPDLVTAGEWESLRLYVNRGGILEPASPQTWKNEEGGIIPTSGWWTALHAADLDGDGDEDLLAGNLGLNQQMKVSPEEPARMYVGDFDDNGAVDPIMTHYIQGREHPSLSRDELLGQMVFLRKKFNDYASFADAGMEDILDADQLERADTLVVNLSESVWVENRGNGEMVVRPLPLPAQVAPVYAFATGDVDGDGILDVVLGGNRLRTRAAWGPWDGNFGQLLLNKGGGAFSYVPQYRSGLSVKGEVRALEMLGDRLIVIRNDAEAVAYVLRDPIQ